MADELRLPAEARYPDELAALAANDTDPRPHGWRLSPRAVEQFVLGSQGAELTYEADGEPRTVTVSKKFYGDDVLVQRAIVTLASDRGLLLVTTFHEIRSGKTVDGVKVDKASSVMSTAEAVGVGLNSALFAKYFDKGTVKPEHIVINLAGTVVKDNRDDLKTLRNYWDVAVKPRAQKQVGQWKAYHRAKKYLK